MFYVLIQKCLGGRVVFYTFIGGGNSNILTETSTFVEPLLMRLLVSFQIASQLVFSHLNMQLTSSIPPQWVSSPHPRTR